MAPVRVVSYSELLTANQCPFKHQLLYSERWTKPLPPDDPRNKGSWWHRVMETHYLVIRRAQRAGKKATLPECRAAAEEILEKAPASIAELIWWMYDGYVSVYGLDDQWKILAVEHAAVVPLPTPRGYTSRYHLKVKIDLVVVDRTTRSKNVLVVDHKSGKDLPSRLMLELDDQFSLYTWCMHHLGKKVFGQLHNAARTLRLKEDEKVPGTTPLDERFRRTPLYRTDVELDRVAIETYQRAEATYRTLAKAKREGTMAPRHTDPAQCTWKCDVLEACLASRKGMDVNRFLRDSGFRQDFSRH